MRSLAIALIGLYRRFVSPLMPAHCRYHPTCSAYAQEALRTHGLLRGGWLALKRIGRCHPWAPGGVDHVPGSGSAGPQSKRGAGSAGPQSKRGAGSAGPQSKEAGAIG